MPQVMALAFREAVSGVITILLGIPQFVATLPERIAAGLKSLPRLMVAAIRGAPEAIVEVFTALPDLIAEAMRGIVDVTVDVLTEVANVFRFVFRAIVGIVEDPLGAILGVIQAAGTRFVEAFRAVWARVNEVTRGELNNALIGISDIFNDVIRTIASKLDFITAMMSNAWALIRDVTTVAWKAIVDVVTGPLETMKGAFDAVRTRVGWLADRIWQLIDAIKSIPSLPDLTPGFSIPSIPFRDRFAGGVRNFHGGMAMVGERGAELVRLPKGADVFSAGDTRRILKPQTAAATASPFQNYGTVNINVRATDTDGVMRELDRYFRQ
jgi:phage-related protein